MVSQQRAVEGGQNNEKGCQSIANTYRKALEWVLEQCQNRFRALEQHQSIEKGSSTDEKSFSVQRAIDIDFRNCSLVSLTPDLIELYIEEATRFA